MMTEHAKGPWYVASALDYFVIKSASGMVARTLGAMPIDEASSRRIVVCVNYCEGVSTGELEAENHISLRKLLNFIDNGRMP